MVTKDSNGDLLVESMLYTTTFNSVGIGIKLNGPVVLFWITGNGTISLSELNSSASIVPCVTLNPMLARLKHKIIKEYSRE